MVATMALLSSPMRIGAFTPSIRRSSSTVISFHVPKPPSHLNLRNTHLNILRLSPVSRLFSSTPTPLTLTNSKYNTANKSSGIVGKYNPQLFEPDIYRWWEDAGCFHPDAKRPRAEVEKEGREPYVIPMPPPNVTGRLHMGHGIFTVLQDVLARFHRMRGHPVLWLPGELLFVFMVSCYSFSW